MAVKIGTEMGGGFKIGTEIVGGMKASTEIFYRKAEDRPRVNAIHTYTITVGQTGGGVRGYWDGNTGSITDASYTQPDGVERRIRQTFLVPGTTNLRFLVTNNGGLTTSSLDQFPEEITVVRGTASYVHYVRKGTPSLQGYGQGIGQDYVVTDGAASSTLQLNSTVTVNLFQGRAQIPNIPTTWALSWRTSSPVFASSYNVNRSFALP